MHGLRRIPGVVALVVIGFGSFAMVGRADSASSLPVVLSDTQSSTMPYGTSVSSVEQPNTEVEPSIAVNPADPNDVVTAFQEARHNGGGDKDNGFATTLDGESSTPAWTYGNLPCNTTSSLCNDGTTYGSFDRGSDAVVAFGVDPTGTCGYKGYAVYVNSLVFDDTSAQGLPSGMAVNTSCDGGVTWKDAVILAADNLDGLNDKNWIVVDNGTGVGHHPGRLYVFWDKVEASIAYSYCDPDSSVSAVAGTGCDKSANWSSVTEVNAAGGQVEGGTWYTLTPKTGIGAFPVVLNDGSVGILFDDELGGQTCSGTNPTDQSCLLASGTVLAWTVIPGAGAAAWPGPLPANEAVVDITPYYFSNVEDQRAGSLPQVAVDPTTDDVYAVWETNMYRTDGGASGGANGTNPSNQNDAVFSVAKPDATGIPGLTPSSWSAPAVINAGPENNFVDHYNPTVAVGADGIVRVAYRQRNEDPSTFNQSTTSIQSEYQQSGDGGTTWSTPLQVNTAAATVNNIPGYGAYDTTNTTEGVFEGDYEQIAAGGPDESYFSRMEAFQQPGTTDPCPFCGSAGFTGPGSADQWQQDFVAHIGPAQPATDTPEAPMVPALAIVALGVGGFVWWRRRRPTA